MLCRAARRGGRGCRRDLSRCAAATSRVVRLFAPCARCLARCSDDPHCVATSCIARASGGIREASRRPECWLHFAACQRPALCGSASCGGMHPPLNGGFSRFPTTSCAVLQFTLCVGACRLPRCVATSVWHRDAPHGAAPLRACAVVAHSTFLPNSGKNVECWTLRGAALCLMGSGSISS